MRASRASAGIALRYALAPVCVAGSALLQASPLDTFLHPIGPFVFGVLVAAWFGGVGPGVLAAFLSAAAQPFAVGDPLAWDLFDLPRFVTLALTGAASR